MLQPITKLNPLAIEARQALTGDYAQSAKGHAAQATMAIINHDQSTAHSLITELAGSREGRDAILAELRSLSREGWYRSLRDFFGHVPQAAFEDYTDDEVGELVGSAYAGMQALGVSTIVESFKVVISEMHNRFKEYLSEPQASSIAPLITARSVQAPPARQDEPRPGQEKPDTDLIVHTLRDRRDAAVFKDIMPAAVVGAFNDFLARKRLSWATEILDFCYESSDHRAALLENDAVNKLADAIKSDGAVVTLRFFAQVARDRKEYRERFETSLGIKATNNTARSTAT